MALARPMGLRRPRWLQASLTAVVLSPQGRVSCTGRLMVQAVNQRGRSPRPPAGHPHGRRYVLCPSRVLLGSRWLLNPAPSALWGADRVGTCGEAWGSLWLRWERQPGGVLCGSHVTTGVPRPGCTSLTATLKAGLWLPVTTSHLKVCALVTQCTSLPETQTSRSDWSHFGHFPYPQPPGHASMGGACGAQ